MHPLQLLSSPHFGEPPHSNILHKYKETVAIVVILWRIEKLLNLSSSKCKTIDGQQKQLLSYFYFSGVFGHLD